MRILAFSNLYPPVFIGGYEIGASQIVGELRRRGHEVKVLASHDYYLQQATGYLHRGHEAAEREQILDAGLCVFGSFTGLIKRSPIGFASRLVGTWRARRAYRKYLREEKPDALLVFNPLGVVAPVLDDFEAYSRETGAPVFAYVSDHWVSTWPAGNPLWPLIWRVTHSAKRWVRFAGRVFRKGLDKAGWLPGDHPLLDGYFYCSDYIRKLSAEKAVGVADHTVAHWGLPDVEKLPSCPPDHFRSEEPLTVLFAGQLLEHKGLKVLLRALAYCKRAHRLVVIGDDATDYAASCKVLAAKLGLADRVVFAGRKKHDEMLRLMAQTGQVLVVPSTWEEPFSIVVLEGMGVGLPVIASETGGTGEGLVDGENGFLVPRDDSRALAAVLERLEGDRGLCERVGARARREVRERYTMAGLVDTIQSHLEAAAGVETPARRAA